MPSNPSFASEMQKTAYIVLARPGIGEILKKQKPDRYDCCLFDLDGDPTTSISLRSCTPPPAIVDHETCELNM